MLLPGAVPPTTPDTTGWAPKTVHPDAPTLGDFFSYRGRLWEPPLGKLWGDRPDGALLLLEESATFQSFLLRPPPHSPPGGLAVLETQHVTH